MNQKLYNRLASCDICPRNCHVNRLNNEVGYCGAAKDTVIYSAFGHTGEEPVISGQNGSGTIFFSGCNLKCVYCQNHIFSHQMKGKSLDTAALAKTMFKLQKENVNNINLVTPTHYLIQILQALKIAKKNGLNIPIVYNTSGYEKKEIIQQLRASVDIYLTDIKYTDTDMAKHFSNASNYPKYCLESVKEMYRQKPTLKLSGDIAKEGLIIRHLVLPNHIQQSKNVLSWIKENTPTACVSVMFQYRPYFKANQYAQINRSINESEYEEIKSYTQKLELNGWIQDLTPQEDMAGVYFQENIEDFL
ncbi:MAG: radical SAM protein [Candidatus Omnitrophica bacterium]|nr:radical SAM protein [Candidatus Omnitrophota bacterium]